MKDWRQKFPTQNTAFVQKFGTKNELSYKKQARKTLMKSTACDLIYEKNSNRPTSSYQCSKVLTCEKKIIFIQALI